MSTVARKKRSSPASSGNRRKQDRISKLQDELIHYILSFIDPKYAVQTSVLSKRWIDIWKSLPFLNFNLTTSIKSSDTIDRVFMLRDHCNIQRLRLALNDLNTDVTTNVSKWIDVAVSKNLHELTLELGLVYDTNPTYKIPPKLLNCKSLKKLTLWSHGGYFHIILPKSMNLPQLEYMCLGRIKMSDGELSTRLFSSCPLLKTLKLVNCDIQTNDQENFTLESLSLKKFEYTHSHGTIDSLFGYQIYKPKIIMISAPNITSLTYNYDDKFQNLSQEEKEANAKCMAKLLVEVNKVGRLDLSPAFLEVLSNSSDLFNSQLPCLSNLKYFKMETWFTRGSMRVIAHLLSISPNIETLIVKRILKRNGSNLADVENDWEARLVSPGMLSQLKFVRIEGMVGCDAEIKLLGFLLKNGNALEEVALVFDSIVGSPERKRQVQQFNNKLRAVPRASSNITMMLV